MATLVALPERLAMMKSLPSSVSHTLAALAESGVPLTLGSDAHAPHQVGRHFALALSGLRRIGVRTLVRFERRQQITVEVAALQAITSN